MCVTWWPQTNGFQSAMFVQCYCGDCDRCDLALKSVREGGSAGKWAAVDKETGVRYSFRPPGMAYRARNKASEICIQ